MIQFTDLEEFSLLVLCEWKETPYFLDREALGGRATLRPRDQVGSVVAPSEEFLITVANHRFKGLPQSVFQSFSAYLVRWLKPRPEVPAACL